MTSHQKIFIYVLCEVHGSDCAPSPPFPPENAIQIRLSVVFAQTPRVLPPMKRGGEAGGSSVIMFVEFKQTFAVSKLHPNCRFLRIFTDKIHISEIGGTYIHEEYQA